MNAGRYPWYDIAEDDQIEQGDFLESCPVFIPMAADSNPEKLSYQRDTRDLIVLTQSCDFVAGREKVTEVLLATIWKPSDLAGNYLTTPKGLEDARRGNLPGVHLLASHDWELSEPGVRFVDFRRLVTLPLEFLRGRLHVMAKRVRLNPPYREHLSQAYARFTMRVGLPVDIPSFRT